MSKSRIEYVDCSWNPYSGCLHGLAECPVYADCWARSLSRRFNQICRGDFKPRFHPERLDEPCHWRKPRRVAVCFMGDLFGDWKLARMARTGCDDDVKSMDDLTDSILDVVVRCPQHQFLFLTKRPENLVEFNLWPSNAWVGISLTGAEPPERQATMLEVLGRVQGAGVRWLSYEPAIKPLAVPFPPWLDWIVIGGWSNKRAPDQLGVVLAIQKARNVGIPYWEKNSLACILSQPLHQELP